MNVSFWPLFLFTITTISIVHGENVTSFSIVRPFNLRRKDLNHPTQKNPKRANLKNCFKPNIYCYVGNRCLESIPLKELSQTRLIHTDINPVDNRAIGSSYSPQRKETIEKCNVGIIVTHEALRRYKFEYHTTADNLDLIVPMNNYRMILDGEMDELLCEPDCEIKMNMKESVRWGGEKFFTDSLPFAVLNTNDKGIRNNDKKGSEEESNIGTILIVCAASVVALILIGVIVGTVIQCRQSAKSARRQAAVQTAIHKASSRSKSNERHGRERTPLISSTTTVSSVRTETR
ncbi:hypothetical protein PRIPAC_85208 [Pristionchus pacificus]|uniref:Uncharacterized protein n=1 Tax=Pristionchus pacificus TaxID=54126 RepID=A0A2A6BNT8_PRIPA|nr:hypothetical protein PRIPAC_85208 [Pristionchus pacificus]|eukprot:PDM67486.1 hypothetical protein PRIPAC_48903 [Pristionchus pacificus]